MRGDDPTRTLDQCRADALVDLMLTNVTVTTTVTLMIPVQTTTVDEPTDSLERDLIVRGGGWEPNSDTASIDADANASAFSDANGTGGGGGARGRGAGLGLLNPLATTDDFGQPTPDPNPLIEPTWAQICAMGYEIPGIGRAAPMAPRSARACA